MAFIDELTYGIIRIYSLIHLFFRMLFFVA